MDNNCNALQWDNKSNKKVFKIVGYDANALYLYCLMQDHLCGELVYETNPFVMVNLINEVMTDRFFGILEVDIEVPEEYYNYFSEFTPIFINTKIGKDIKLVGIYKAEKIILITPLIKWYLNHGLKITKIYGYIRATPRKIFKEFGEWVVNERRKGKIDKAYATKAECAKLIGNSAYGGTILNKEKLFSTMICDFKKFKRNIYSPFLRQFEEYNPDTFELSMKKRKIVEDSPIQIGFAVLQYAKLRMLEFYYDCLFKHIGFDNFQLIQMDTDSFYFAITEDGYNKLNTIEGWFPTKDQTKIDFAGGSNN